MFANLRPLNRVQRSATAVCLKRDWEGGVREETREKEKESDSCCIFTQTWSVLPLCHSTTWTELCGRLRHTVTNDTKQYHFCSHCGSYGVRRADTASVSYHRFLFGDTCILSMSPTQPFRLTARSGRKWPSEAVRGASPRTVRHRET